MKIKIIDLLNKIANREESINVETKYDSDDWEKNDFLFNLYKEFEHKNNYEIVEFLNDYVEIIEEPKKIEKIKSNGDEFYSDYIDTWISKNKTDAYCEFLMNKINELIDVVNELKRDKLCHTK